LATELQAVRLSSDEVRDSLSHKARRSGNRVFAELHRRFERALEQQRSIVLDSTGMSPRFRALLRAHREKLVHVHLVLNDPKHFEEREKQRTDRAGQALAFAAFARSRGVEFHNAPDLVLDTDELTPERVYEQVRYFLRFTPPG
jgi:predicted kinase